MFTTAQYTSGGTQSPVNHSVCVAREWTTMMGPVLLLAVADGLAGHRNGRECAQVVLDGLVAECESVLAQSGTDVLDRLAWAMDTALEKAHDELRLGYAQSGGAGAAVAASLLWQGRYLVKNIGDVRALLASGGGVVQLSLEHTYTAAEVAAGRLYWGDSFSHPKYNVLTRCVGMGAWAPPHQASGDIPPGNVLLLGTSGYFRNARPGQIEQIAAKLVAGNSKALTEYVLDMRVLGEDADMTAAAAISQ